MELKHCAHAFVCVHTSEILWNGCCIASVEVVSFPWSKWRSLIRVVDEYK